jgi:hypothetical protein
MAMYDDADRILRRQGLAESERSNFDSMWQDIAELMLPRQADFLGRGNWRSSQGQNRNNRIFDEVATQALDDGVSIFESYVMPRGARWQMLAPADDELLRYRHVREWYERKTARLFQLRNAPYSGFATQIHESVASLLGFGGQSTWVELRRDPKGKPMGLFYRAEHIGGLWIFEDAWGRVDTTHRKLRLSARQALQKWRDNPPETALRAQRDNKLDEEHDYLHMICPRSDWDPDRIDVKGKPWRSCYLSIADKQVFDEGGYRALPRAYSRYEQSPNETYGRGPGINVLPAVKAAQEIMRDVMTATEFMARPALLAQDDAQDLVLRYMPGGVSYGGLDYMGNPTVKPMFEGSDIQAALVLQERVKTVIERAFFGGLLRIRKEQKTHVSATDVMEQSADKGVLLSPLARQETEWFAPLGDREVDLMAEMGEFDDMPGEVREAGGASQFSFDNPLGRAQKADQAAGYFRTLEGVTPIITAKPELVNEFLAKVPFDKTLDGLLMINNVPASWLADEEEHKASKDAMAQQAQMQSLLAAAPVASKVALDLSKAGGANAVAA